MLDLKKAALAVFAAVCTLPFAMGQSLAADYARAGDVNNDGNVGLSDVVRLQKILIKQADPPDVYSASGCDVNRDTKINAVDLGILKQYLVSGMELPSDPVTTTTTLTTTVTETTTVTTTTTEDSFIKAAADDLSAFLPSSGKSQLVVLYVDFPDCPYPDNGYSVDEVADLCFGEEDSTDANYPFESMRAFYKRSSKGRIDLGGTVLRYTTKHNLEYYSGPDYNEDGSENHFAESILAVKEAYEYFDDKIDFSKYDSDGDGYIDATLITVPNAAGDDKWWPCAGGAWDYSFKVDGKYIGHLITGNAEPQRDCGDALYDEANFVSSYLHEMGHCMGLPDYYLYEAESDGSIEGLKGLAGNELMDVDAYSDFGAVSKLILGWYRNSQVNVYDPAAGEQTFRLNSAQSENGNCIIIPRSSPLKDLNTEYFVIELNSIEGNNSRLNTKWGFYYPEIEKGVRIFHADTESETDDWGYTSFVYDRAGSYAAENPDGKTFIRLVNDNNGAFKSGSYVSAATEGFGWYDDKGKASIDPGINISIKEDSDGTYLVTIKNN